MEKSINVKGVYLSNFYLFYLLAPNLREKNLFYATSIHKFFISQTCDEYVIVSYG